MREAILGCLSAYLRAANFTGKATYINECNGLKQLSDLIIGSDQDDAKLGTGAIARKIKLKLRGLLYDFVLNDDNIVPAQPTLVRDALSGNSELKQSLFATIANANLDAPQEF